MLGHSVAEEVAALAQLRLGLVVSLVRVAAAGARRPIRTRRRMRAVACLALRVSADGVEPFQRRTRVTGGTGRRPLDALRPVRTMARGAALRGVRVKRIRLVVVAARARSVVSERSRMRIVTARARRMTRMRRLRLLSMTAAARRLRHRSVGSTVTRIAARVSGPHARRLRFLHMASRAEARARGREMERVRRVARGARRSLGVEPMIVLRARVARGARRRAGRRGRMTGMRRRL